jgi:3'(2'), 5'-bisphosphate nucleotidase
MVTDPLLLDLVDIARAASDVILKIYERDFKVETKADQSPVTEADEAGEALIMERVRSRYPELSIVAEEAVNRGQIPQQASRFLLVDPLDGTKEFIQRRGDFTVNLGLIENGSPVLGVVAAPARGEVFAGKVGVGAWMAKGDMNGGDLNWKPISVKPSDPSGLVVVASRSHLSDETKEFIERFEVADWAQAGSSIKFCLIANGQADLYPRLGRTMEWDTAAGDAVLRAAGGTVQTLDGKPFQYGKRNQACDVDFANPHFVAASAFDWYGYLGESA